MAVMTMASRLNAVARAYIFPADSAMTLSKVAE